MCEHSTIRGQCSAQGWQNLCCHSPAIWARRMFQSAEDRALSVLVFCNKLTHLVNRVNAAEIAFALGRAPSKEAVPAEENPIDSRILTDSFFDEQCQLESRALPRHPDYFAAMFLVELFEFTLAVCAGCKGYGPVRMQMVHMRKGKQRVQRRIDRGGNAILAESRK